MDQLNAPQRRAVDHVQGPLIVFAGAGSGKTRVITHRVARLVQTERVPPWTILAVTFTNKAAGEMRSRLSRMLGEGPVKQLWIGTFHAVCARLLRRYSASAGLDPRFTIYDDADQKAVMKRVVKDLDLDDRRFPPAQVLARIHQEKQEGRGPESMRATSYADDVAQRCFVEYQRRLAAAHAVDFEDLLLGGLRVAENDGPEGGHLRDRFRHVLVDEFQDTNLVQYRFVRALCRGHRNLCVVGDDDQSIYRWRGADIRNIRGFTSDYPDAMLVKLEQNYRSTGNVVKAALGVIRPSQERQPKELWTANEAGEPIGVVHCATERDEAGFVALGVAQELRQGASARDLAVFYRVHAQSRVLEEALRAEGIPYQIVGGTKFFDRAEVKDALAYLRLIANPASDVDLLRIINVPARKIGGKTVDRLLALAHAHGTSAFEAIGDLCRSGDLSKAARHSLIAFRDLIVQLAAAAQTATPVSGTARASASEANSTAADASSALFGSSADASSALFGSSPAGSSRAAPRELAEQVLAESGYTDWLASQDSVEADARLDNVNELLGSIGDYEQDAAAAGETPTLADYLTTVSLQADADQLKEIARVPMMTVHAAKGLEFDAVWLTGLEEQLFPLGRAQEPIGPAQLEEERRLAYVAITRARRRLFITHTAMRTLYGRLRYNAASRFLADLPPGCQRRLATRAMEEQARQDTRARRSPDYDEDFFDARASESGWSDSAEMADFDELQVRKGAQVRHARFGVGTVLAVRAGPDPTVTVKFPGTGPKQIKLSFLSPA